MAVRADLAVEWRYPRWSRILVWTLDVLCRVGIFVDVDVAARLVLRFTRWRMTSVCCECGTVLSRNRWERLSC